MTENGDRTGIEREPQNANITEVVLHYENSDRAFTQCQHDERTCFTIKVRVLRPCGSREPANKPHCAGKDEEK
jgi:hypothetical protein